MPLAGAPMIVRQIERLRRSALLDQICVAIPDRPESDAIEEVLDGMYLTIVRGDEHDVLSRFQSAANLTNADIILRSTSDCPFVSPQVVDVLLKLQEISSMQYVRTAMTHGFPHGYDAEVFTRKALEEAATEAVDPFDREHVTPFIWRNAKRYPALHLDSFPNRRQIRLVVDFPEDYEVAAKIYEKLYTKSPSFTDDELMAFIALHPDLMCINEHRAENWVKFQSQIS